MPPTVWPRDTDAGTPLLYVSSDSCYLPPPLPIPAEAAAAGRDASSSRRLESSWPMVKPPAADTGVRPSSATGRLTPLSAAAGGGEAGEERCWRGVRSERGAHSPHMRACLVGFG